VSAYNGAAPSIESKDILGAAAPEAFDRTLDKPAVLKAVKPLIKA
jgi:hypothetical protein